MTRNYELSAFPKTGCALQAFTIFHPYHGLRFSRVLRSCYHTLMCGDYGVCTFAQMMTECVSCSH